MILQALLERYEDLAALGQIARPGWGNAKVSLALTLDPEGRILQATSVKTEQTRGTKSVLEKQVMEVPEPTTRTVGVKANFLCDNAAYILGLDSKGKPERAVQCFDACAALHKEILGPVDHPAARAVVSFFEHWSPAEAETYPALGDVLDELKAGANLVFRFGGEFVHKILVVRSAWQSYRDRGGEGDVLPCLVTGRRAPAARLHPSIKGVRDAQSSGAALVSFNATAFESYGKEQGYNAPVSEYAAFAYTTALNALLSDREHTQQLGDATVVFWAKGGEDAYQDLAALMLGGGQGADTLLLKNAMEHLAAGKSVQWEGEPIRPETPFYILGLAPNAARLSVRLFLRDTFGGFALHMAQHQARLEIARPAYDNREQLSVWELLRETVNPNSRDKAPSSVMAGDTLRAIFTGGSYPASLLQGVALRIRAEHKISRGRAAIIKAYYLRSQNKDCPEEVLQVSLNESCTDVPYTLGRLFAVLEFIQESANPGINSTIKDKYFNSASATPAVVFPSLVNLAQKHLRKLDDGLAIHWNKALSKLLNILPDSPNGYPLRLNLPQQGAFQLGYYHQRQAQFTTKKEEPSHV